jgi:hypothetical protein
VALGIELFPPAPISTDGGMTDLCIKASRCPMFWSDS